MLPDSIEGETGVPKLVNDPVNVNAAMEHKTNDAKGRLPTMMEQGEPPGFHDIRGRKCVGRLSSGIYLETNRRPAGVNIRMIDSGRNR